MLDLLEHLHGELLRSCELPAESGLRRDDGILSNPPLRQFRKRRGVGGDLIATGHQYMNHVLACMGTAGMAVFVGTVLGSKVFSPKLAIYADEVIEQARLLARGIEVDDGFSLMREIAAAGPAGNFLSSNLTLKNFRQAYFKSAIFPRFTMEDWQSQGYPKAEAYLSRFTKTLIEDLSISDESLAMIEKGEAFVSSLKTWPFGPGQR